jgi:hypothetical protein
MKTISNYLIGFVILVLFILGMFRECGAGYELQIRKTRYYENREDKGVKYIFYKPNYFLTLRNAGNHNEIILYEISGESAIHYFSGLWNINKDRGFFANSCLDVFGIRYYENSEDVFNLNGSAVGFVILDNRGYEIEYKSKLDDFSDRIIFYDDGFSMNNISGIKIDAILSDEQIGLVISEIKMRPKEAAK